MTVPSVLWRCWLGGRKGIRPVKNWVVGCWHGYLSYVICYMPLPLAAFCFSKIQIGFTLLVPAHPGSSGQRAVKRVRVCVCVCHRMKSRQCTYRIQTFPAHLCFSNKAINKLSQYDTKMNYLKCNKKLRKGSRRTVKSNVKYTDIAVRSLTCCAPLLQCLGRLSLPLFVGR